MEEMRREFKFIVLALFVGVFLAGCKKNKNQDELDLPVIKFGEAPDSLRLTDKFKNISGFQLEMTDESILGEIERVIPAGDELIVFADNEIFIFSKEDGKYLRTIGSIGEGPEEYLDLVDVYYDPAENAITGLDRLKSEFVSYGVDGRFIGKKKIERPMAYITGLERSPDGTILICNRLISREPDCAFSIMTENKGLSDVDRFSPLESKNSMVRWAAKPMSACGEELKFVKMLTDTLYQIRDGKESPMYKLDFGKKVPSKETVSQFGEFDLDYVNVCLGNGWSPGIDKMFETSDYIVLLPHRSQYEGQYWIDKCDNTGYHFSSTPLFDDEVRKAVRGKAILKLIGSDEDNLISCFNPAIVPLCFGKAFGDGLEDVVFPESVVEAIGDVDPEGNPVLVIYSNS